MSKSRKLMTIRGVTLSSPKIGERDQMLVTKGDDVLGTVRVSSDVWAALKWHQSPAEKRGQNPQWEWCLPREEDVTDLINGTHTHIDARGPNEWMCITPRLGSSIARPLPDMRVVFLVTEWYSGDVVGRFDTLEAAVADVTNRMDAAHSEDALLKHLGLLDVVEK